MTVKTVGLDLAKDVFQVHCVSATGRKIINKKIKRAKLIAFFERCRAAWLGWRLADHPITGNASCANSVMTFGSSQQPMSNPM